MAVITAPFTQSETGPPFSYEMPVFDTNYVLSYSTLQNLGLGAGSSNASLQGSMGVTLAHYNTFSYGGGHIPPSSPSFDSAHQHFAEPNINHSLFGVGSQALPSCSIPLVSTPFSLFDAFGNNAFLSAVISAGGNPGYGQKNTRQGTIPT
jgi:hypothetical protein